MIWGTGLYLAASQEEAIRRVEPAHDERYKWFAPFGFVRYADEHGRTWGTPGAPAKIPSLRDGVQQKAWFCGSPGQVIDGIKSIEAKYPGLEDFMIHWAEGLSPGEFEEQLRWFARDVMPAFSVEIRVLIPPECARPRRGAQAERTETPPSANGQGVPFSLARGGGLDVVPGSEPCGGDLEGVAPQATPCQVGAASTG